jgi:hypothetical protein
MSTDVIHCNTTAGCMQEEASFLYALSHDQWLSKVTQRLLERAGYSKLLLFSCEDSSSFHHKKKCCFMFG